MDARAIIAKVRRKSPLNDAELGWFAKGLAGGEVSDAQAGAFAMAVCLNGLGEAGRVALTQAMREDALCCYYITQCCNWMQTSFTVPDFQAWSRRSFAELAHDVTVDTVITSVAENTPVSLLNHRRRLATLGRVVARGTVHV